jgi:hypothetical protein
MSDPWERLQSAAISAIDWIWSDLAKSGLETAALAPLAEFPHAAGWLAASMAMSADDIVRKLGAMLAGLIADEEQVGLLSEMLAHERQLFCDNPLSANSATEDIMFAATRWTKQEGAIHAAGVQVLSDIVSDALSGTPWNTANWAAANLYIATNGEHPTLQQLQSASPEQLANQPFLRIVAAALRGNDQAALARTAAAPSPIVELRANAPNAHLAHELWAAARAAEEAL